jgi:hypothetical protein
MERRLLEHAMAGSFPPICCCDSKSLFLCEEFVQYIVPALQELGERATDVLHGLESPFLRELQVSDPPQEAFGRFVAARRLLIHPVVVSRWDEEI